MSFLKKHYLSILGFLFAAGTWIVENEKEKKDMTALKEDVTKEVLKQLEEKEK